MVEKVSDNVCFLINTVSNCKWFFNRKLYGPWPFSLEIDDEGQELVKLNNHDLMIEGGFGIDFYLQYFKFSPQIFSSLKITESRKRTNSNVHGWEVRSICDVGI